MRWFIFSESSSYMKCPYMGLEIYQQLNKEKVTYACI